jgi:hypothetical protein
MISGLRSDNYEDKLKELKLLSLSDRRIQADIVQTFKILKGIDKVDPSTWFKLVDPNRPATRSTNVQNTLQIDRKRTDLANNFFTTRAAKHWNELPDSIKSLQNLQTFKKKVAEYLASRNQ